MKEVFKSDRAGLTPPLPYSTTLRMFNFEAILGHCGPLFCTFWVRNGLSSPKRQGGGGQNWENIGSAPTAAVLLIFPLLCAQKCAKWGVKWGVKMLKTRFLVLARNASK